MIHLSFWDPSESAALQKNLNLWEGFRDKYLESKLWYSQSAECPFGYIPQSLVVTNIVLLTGWLLTSLAVSSPSSLQIHVCLNAGNIKFILNKEMKQPLSPRDVFSWAHALCSSSPALLSAPLLSRFPSQHDSFCPRANHKSSVYSFPHLDLCPHEIEQNTYKAPALSALIVQLHPDFSCQSRRAAASCLSTVQTLLWLSPVEQIHPAALSKSKCMAQMHHPSSLSIMVQSIF